MTSSMKNLCCVSKPSIPPHASVRCWKTDTPKPHRPFPRPAKSPRLFWPKWKFTPIRKKMMNSHISVKARAQRMPVGLWDKIKPVMQLTRPRMVQLLNILQFPNNLLDLANRYQLPERVLREILTKPEELWDQYLRLSIQNQLTLRRSSRN